MRATTYSLGLLDESDFVSLSPDLTLIGNRLFDRVTGARHNLHDLAAMAVAGLAGGVRVHVWLDIMQHDGLSKKQVSELIFFLNDIAAFNVRRSLAARRRLLAFRIRGSLQGAGLPVLGRRFSADIRGLTQAILASMGLLSGLIVLVAGLFYAADFAGLEVISHAILFWSTILVSTILHEHLHAVLIQPDPAVVVQRGLRLGLLHGDMPPGVELFSAFAGPLLGAVSAVIMPGLVSVISELRYGLFLGCATAFFHLCSLLPVYGDGAYIWKRLKGFSHG